MAKLTKADIYRKYGISFDGKKIDSPIGKICGLLKEGNDKTGKTVLTFSLLPGTETVSAVVNGYTITERGTCACDCKGCYAKTGHYNQTSCKTSLLINTYLVNHHLDFVKACLMAQIEIAGACEIRVHAAGDFNTADPEAYANMWHAIASEYDGDIMWTYTKIKKFETLFDDLRNANIVRSVIPHVGVNYGTCEYIISAYRILKDLGEPVYICRCGFDDSQHCAGCGVCAHYKYVLFLEHSTGYNAKKDPLFKNLLMIVNNQ